MIKAMLLAAGAGTRLRPLTDKCPKPMLRIGGRPLLEHTVRLLKRYGIREAAVNLHHLPGKVMNHFGDGSRFGVGMHYSVETELLGSAGALVNFRDFFDDTFVVIYGDLLTRANLKKMISFHRKHRGMVTVGLYKVDNPTECGLVDLDAGGRISRFVEKPKKAEVFTDLANTGVYVLEPEVLKRIPRKVPCDFGKDLFPRLLKDNVPMFGCAIKEYLIDIGTMKKYRKAAADAARGRI